jgi:hypothetical protein
MLSESAPKEVAANADGGGKQLAGHQDYLDTVLSVLHIDSTINLKCAFHRLFPSSGAHVFKFPHGPSQPNTG